MYPHGYIGMTTNPKLTDWSDNQSLDEFGDGDEEQDDTTNADDDEEAGDDGA